MKQVLLAINGDIPTNSVFQYSVDFCKRISAELNILQFIQNRKITHCISSTKNRVGRLGKFLEAYFAGAAFAEQGVFYMADEFLSGVSDPLRDLIKFNKIGVPFKVTLSNGDPETELSSYIDNHRKIVLMIFDPSKDMENQPKKYLATVEQIKKKLYVPLVVLKS